MKAFKTERDWKDLERADKVALFIGVLVWALLETGVYLDAKKHLKLKQNVFKTEMIKQR
jgi:hypothetical protein